MEEILFYRCLTCSKPVSQWDIKDHGKCRNCGGVKIKPADLTFIEKVKQIIAHPKFWSWKDELR